MTLFAEIITADAHHDLDEYFRVNSDTRATGALLTHRRCGATFRVTFTDA